MTYDLFVSTAPEPPRGELDSANVWTYAGRYSKITQARADAYAKLRTLEYRRARIFRGAGVGRLTETIIREAETGLSVLFRRVKP